MTDYLDFMQQAELDLNIAEKLLHDEIYWLSAFCIQQGIEKYLKAFLLKYRIFDNPEKLGHIQYYEIFNEMIDTVDVSTSEDLLYEEFKNNIISVLKSVQKFIVDLTNSHQKKLLIWKDSLGIPLKDHENKIIDGLTSRMIKQADKTIPMLVEMMKRVGFDFSGIDLNKLDAKTKFVMERFKAIGDSTTQLAEGKSLDFKILQNYLVEIFAKMAYGTGSDSLSKNESDQFMKIIALNECINWADVVLDTYPHEEISRYPIMIEGTDSLELYRKNQEGLKKLLDRTRVACNDIRSKILLFPPNV